MQAISDGYENQSHDEKEDDTRSNACARAIGRT
jgi:hypothetical protein